MRRGRGEEKGRGEAVGVRSTDIDASLEQISEERKRRGEVREGAGMRSRIMERRGESGSSERCMEIEERTTAG